MLFATLLPCILIACAMLALGDPIESNRILTVTEYDSMVKSLEELERKLEKSCSCCSGWGDKAGETQMKSMHCPQNWHKFNGTCWQWFDEPKSWEDAQQACVQNGANLATVTSAEENTFASNLRQSVNLQQDLSCFQKISGYRFVGHQGAIFHSSGLKQCLRRCKLASLDYDFVCKSISFQEESQDCILHTESRATQPHSLELVVTGSMTDYYENGCLPNRNADVPDESCFVKMPNSILIGHAKSVLQNVTEETCLEACKKITDALTPNPYFERCSSVIYYPNDKECILNDVSRFTHPSLFSPDSKSNYYDNLCQLRIKELETVGSGYGETPGLAPRKRLTITEEECVKSAADILFVIDGSGSVGPGNFRKMQNFLKTMIDQFDIGSDQTRIGLVQFTDDVFLEFPFDRHLTKASLQAAIDALKYRQGLTNLGEALQFSYEQLLKPGQGRRENVPAYVFVITDGISRDDPVPAAASIRQLGVQILSIGVGFSVDRAQLSAITSDPSHIFVVDNFNYLNTTLISSLQEKRCKNTVTTTVESGETTNELEPSNAVWLGLNDRSSERTFRWLTDQPLTFDRWLDGTSHRLDHEHKRNCVQLEDEVWKDVSCDDQRTYICQRKTEA